MQPIPARFARARFPHVSLLLLLSFAHPLSADPGGDYQGWLWETGIINESVFIEEQCFGQSDMTIVAGASWTIGLTGEVCWGRTTTNTGRSYNNAPPFSVFSEEPDQSTQPLVSAGGNLYELYGEEFDEGVGQGEERFGVIMSLPSNDNLLIAAAFDAQSDQFGDEYFRSIELLAKSTIATTVANLEGTSWRIGSYTHSFSGTNVNAEFAFSSVQTLDLLPFDGAYTCTYTTSGIFGPDFTDNGDEYFALQFDGGVNFDDRTVRGGVASKNFDLCTYAVQDGYLAITRTVTLASDPLNPFVNTARFVVSDDNRHLVPAPALVTEDSSRSLTVGYRAANGMSVDAIDNTYFFYLTLSEFGADGAGAVAAGFGDRDWQEQDIMGRGKVVFDSMTNGTTPTGESGAWYSCSIEAAIGQTEHEFTGSTSDSSVTLNAFTPDNGDVQFDECDFQLGSDGDLSMRIVEFSEDGNPDDDFVAILRGYVNDNGEIISLAWNEVITDPLNPGNSSKDRADVMFVLAMQYTGDPDADADSDGISNFKEFKIPLPIGTTRNDHDGDSVSDILWRNGSTGQNWLYLISGGAVDTSVGLPSVSTAWIIAGTGDYDGDGNADILWRNTSTGQNWLYLMNGATVQTSIGLPSVAANWTVAGNGDFNGDGNADILWRSDTGQNWLYLMNGATVQTSIGLPSVATNWTVAGNGDHNGDGSADILWRSDTGQNWLYLMNGATVQTSIGLPSVATNWTVAGNGDYNGDGNADILWRSNTGQNWMYLMNGATVETSEGVVGVSTAWFVAGDGDYDGDGNADILWRSTSGQNWLYLMDGATVGSSIGLSTVSTDWQIVDAP